MMKVMYLSLAIASASTQQLSAVAVDESLSAMTTPAIGLSEIPSVAASQAVAQETPDITVPQRIAEKAILIGNQVADSAKAAFNKLRAVAVPASGVAQPASESTVGQQSGSSVLVPQVTPVAAAISGVAAPAVATAIAANAPNKYLSAVKTAASATAKTAKFAINTVTSTTGNTAIAGLCGLMFMRGYNFGLSSSMIKKCMGYFTLGAVNPAAMLLAAGAIEGGFFNEENAKKEAIGYLLK